MKTHEDIRVELGNFFSKYFTIILNEVRTPQGRVDMVLDYKVLVEIKTTAKEFDEGKEQLERYKKYFEKPVLVLTNGEIFLMKKKDKWVNVKKEDLIQYAKKRYTLSDIASAMSTLTRHIPKLKEIFQNNEKKLKARKVAYTTLLKGIYNTDVDELFFYHTLIDIIITKFLKEVVGELPFQISPPVVNWWSEYEIRNKRAYRGD